jgi:hypothetical protein
VRGWVLRKVRAIAAGTHHLRKFAPQFCGRKHRALVA